MIPLVEVGRRREPRVRGRGGRHPRLAVRAQRRLHHPGHHPAHDPGLEVRVPTGRAAVHEVAEHDRHTEVAVVAVADVLAVPPRLELAVGAATVARGGVAVVAFLVQQLEAVAARRGAAGGAHADGLRPAVGAATVTAEDVAVVARFVPLANAVAADRRVAGDPWRRAGGARLHPARVAATVAGHVVAVVASLAAHHHAVAADRDAARAHRRADPAGLDPAILRAAVSRRPVVVVARLRSADQAVPAGDRRAAGLPGRGADPVRLRLAVGRAAVAALRVPVVAGLRGQVQLPVSARRDGTVEARRGVAGRPQIRWATAGRPASRRGGHRPRRPESWGATRRGARSREPWRRTRRRQRTSPPRPAPIGAKWTTRGRIRDQIPAAPRQDRQPYD